MSLDYFIFVFFTKMEEIFCHQQNQEIQATKTSNLLRYSNDTMLL